METYLTSEILRALSSGDLTKLLAYIAIFVFLWIEVRGLKNQLKTLNKTIAKTLADGEDRFHRIEHDIDKHENRIEKLEQLTMVGHH